MLSKKGYILKKNEIANLILQEIKKDLTVTPVLTFNINSKIKPESFPVYSEDEDNIYIPKYYGIEKFGKPKINNENCGVKTNITFNGILRSKQLDIIEPVLNKLETNDGGLICIGCGGGKTVLSLYISSQLKVKTLVIVHKEFLLNQWKLRAQEFTNARIGIIQRDKIDIEDKDIVIGMLQSIAKDKYSSDVFKDFGLVIFDEAHHAPSKYFSKALPIIACKKTLALSATPKRSDKLEKILYWYFGNILYKAPVEILNTLLINIYKYNTTDKHFKEYKMYNGVDINRSKTINKLVEIIPRNKFIVKLITELLLEEGRKIIVLSDRLEHLKIIKENIDLLEITTTSYYIGGTKQKKLDEAEKAQLIFATYSMASEGLDIPSLNTLVMITPRKEVEQAIGRITRKNDHPVQPMVIDIVDQLSSFSRQGIYRKKFYSKKEFNIKMFEVEEDTITIEVDQKIIKNDIKEIKNEDVEFLD